MQLNEIELEKELAWMPIYWDRFLSGTTDFDATEIGGYVLLIAHQWKHGSVPADIKKIKKISRVLSNTRVQHILAKFKPFGDDKLVNIACENIRNEQKIKHLRKSKSGSENAKKRWQRDASGIANGIQKIEDRNKNKEIVVDTITSTEKKTGEFAEFELMELQPLKEKLLSDDLWIERSAILLRISLDEFKKAIEDFIKYLELSETHKGLKDAKRHIVNWYPKRKVKNETSREAKRI